jgi:hypothetical protein
MANRIVNGNTRIGTLVPTYLSTEFASTTAGFQYRERVWDEFVPSFTLSFVGVVMSFVPKYITHVIGAAAPIKVGGNVIQPISVSVTHFSPLEWFRSIEFGAYQLMNAEATRLPIAAQRYRYIRSRCTGRKNPTRYSLLKTVGVATRWRTIYKRNQSLCSSQIANFIQPFVTGDGQPVFHGGSFNGQ